MFHRVKSETQTPPKQNEQEVKRPHPAAQYQQQSSKPYVPPSRPVAPPPQAAAPTAPKTPTPQQQQQKDKPAMQNQDQNTETESADDNKPQRPLDIPGSAYAQSNAGGMRSPGAYASAYSANAFSSKTNASTDTNDRRLTIGRGITMSGEIEACDHLLVEGTVEAALKGASKLDIAESGVFYGTVSIEEAEVAGRFEGEITVNGRLTIRSTGTITGSISYKELEVESGAVIDGRITPISAENQRSQPKNQGRKDSPQTLKAPPREPQAANSDGELFSERERAAAE